MPSPEIDLHGHHWVNTIGHSAGILVFGILFLLIYCDARRSQRSVRILPLLSTLLALGWDLGLLIGIAVRATSAFWANASAAIAFACLSLLPAVLLDLGTRGESRPLRLSGYILGTFCALLHLSEVFVEGPDIHSFALIALAGGFAILALLSYLRSQVSPAASVCLFLLSFTFLHFRDAAGTPALWAEIILHHAGIPIALFVVLQDYRFLLFDAFLRLAANGLLAGAFVTLLWFSRHTITTLTQSEDPFRFGMLLVAAALTLLLFAKWREATQRWLTSCVFLRQDPDSILQSLRNLEGDESAILDRAARIIAEYFRAEQWHWTQSSHTRSDASTTIQFLKGDQIQLHLSGRRFLSEDIETLDRYAEAVGREIDRARTRELERLMLQAELKALQAQIHPHFLFNALNALYGSIPRQAADARRLVLSLSAVFRYFLTTSKNTVSLEEELTIIEAYLEIERARLGPRLTTVIDIPAELRHHTIPVLSIEPLVENAIKHGVAAQPGPGSVKLTAHQDSSHLVIAVHDSGPGPGQSQSKEGNQVGLDNVRRRLNLHYSDSASLEIRTSPTGTIAELRIPVQPSNLTAQSSSSAASNLVLGD